MTIFFLKFPLGDTLGGAEFHTLNLARHFQRQGHAVKLFTSDGRLFRLFEKHALPRRRLFLGWEPTSKKSLLLWPLTYLLALLGLEKLLTTCPAGSVFFCQSLTEKLVLTPLALGRGLKVVWVEHKVPGRWLKLNPLRPRYEKLAKLVQIITVSRFAKREFIKLGIPEKNLQVVYPGVKPTNYPPATMTLSGARGPEKRPATVAHTIGLLSRLAPEKGIWEFLQAILPALQKHGDWQMRIAGEGNEQPKIQKFLAANGLRSRINLLGFVPNLGGFFSQITVLAYPSLAMESFGLAVVQAQARGIPVVATRGSALSEIIEHQQSGFLVEPGKPGQWATYLEKLTNPVVYQTVSAKARFAAESFSEAKMFAAFDELLTAG